MGGRQAPAKPPPDPLEGIPERRLFPEGDFDRLPPKGSFDRAVHDVVAALEPIDENSLGKDTLAAVLEQAAERYGIDLVRKKG